MNNIKISIIVPVYNSEFFLEKCILSLTNQTYRDIEIICVDDGSLDNSLSILEGIAKNDPRIKIIKQENKGISKARNRGIQNSSGKYLMFVDSDDWLDPNNCEVVLDIAEKEDADVVMWSYIREFPNYSKSKDIFDEDYIIFTKNEVKEKLHRRFCGLFKEELKKPENADAIAPVWAKLYKKKLIEDNHINFVDLKLIGTLEDGLFNFQLFNYVNRAVFINRNFYHYRKNNNSSLTTVYKPKLYSQWQKLFDFMEEEIKRNQLENFYRESLNNRIAFSIVGLGINELSSSSSLTKKIKNLMIIISNEKYQMAFKNFEFKFLPIHWKVFFVCAKYKVIPVLFALLYIMHKKTRK